MRTILFGFLLLTPTAAIGQQAEPIKPDTEFRVRLLAPLSTETAQKGDKITAQITAPDQFKDAMMEGEVRESKSGNKFKGKSTLVFTFKTIVMNDGSVIPVSSDVKGFTNSKGQPDVDEEGQIIEKKNNVGKIAAGGGIGALIGAIAGGGKGAAIGAGIGAGAAIIMVQFGAKAPNIRFDPGSEVLLSVNPRKEDRK